MSGSHPFPGIAYLRTLRRDDGAWWRLLGSVVLGTVALFATAVLALLAVIAGAAVVGADYDVDFDNVDAGLLLATNLGLAALIPCAAGIVWLLYGVRPRWVASHRPRLRWRWLLSCVGMASAVWALLFVLATIGAAVDRSTPIDGAVYGFIAVVVLTTPLQAAGEEYLFRGLLLQSLGATRMPPWLCMAVSSALFATAHGQFAPPLFADRFVLGMALSWLAIRTGGLEAGIAVHAVKNLSVLIPASLLDQVDDALDPTGVTWIPLIVDVVLLAFVLPWMLSATTRRRRDGRLLPGEPQPWLAEASPTATVAMAAPWPTWQPPPYGYPPPWYGWQPPPGGPPQPMPPGWYQPPPPGWQPPPSAWHQPPPSAWLQPPPSGPEQPQAEPDRTDPSERPDGDQADPPRP